MKNNDFERYIKFLETIVELANKDQEQYAMKVYHTSELSRITTDIIDRELTNESSLIWIIGLKDTINQIDEWGSIDCNGYPPIGEDPYHPYAFQHIFTKLINNSCSLVIMTNHSNEYQVFPKNWEIKKQIYEKGFETHPMLSRINCYTYDDELGNVVSKLFNYINDRNIDLRKISNNELSELLNEFKEKSPVLSKKI